jgi:hypothetical protein
VVLDVEALGRCVILLNLTEQKCSATLCFQQCTQTLWGKHCVGFAVLTQRFKALC